MKILFVCTGNICRSAMAESLFNHHAQQQGLEIKAHSSGTDATPGNSATDLAVDVLADRGIDLKDHRARQLTSDQISDSQIVIAMTRQHEAAIAKEDQPARSRTRPDDCSLNAQSLDFFLQKERFQNERRVTD